MQQTEIMTHMANVLANVVPQSMGRFLPLIVGLVSVPLTLMFDTDSFFFGMLPVLIGIGNEFGVNPAHIAIAMVVCRNCATFISPVVPATFLGTGLAGVEIKDHIKNSFFWIWGVSIICLISGIILGVIKF
jgi:CitMHS family citrate-Mg2+:H+ or citrate-Ca2+:H+ symporter